MTKNKKYQTVESVNDHFFDSGSFTLWGRAVTYAKETGEHWSKFYDTDEFYMYMDGYVEFVKEFEVAIDNCANVDVIPTTRKDTQVCAELSYRNLKYLEEKGITPVPVVHFRTDMFWLKKYIKEDYNFIGLGGLVGSASLPECWQWLTRCFEVVCDTEDKKPCAKIHGFGVTSHELLLMFPWYSVDSTTWAKNGGFGQMIIPRWSEKRNEFVFTPHQLGIPCTRENIRKCVHPWQISMSEESPKQKQRGGPHYRSLRPMDRDIVHKWLDFVGVTVENPWDDKNKMNFENKEGMDGYEKREKIGTGVDTNHNYRRISNLRFYEELRKNMPPYPWSFHTTRPKGFGFT